MDWQSGKIKLYTEAGLALLLVLTLAVAGATGVLSPREEKETVSVSEAEFQSEGNEATGGGRNHCGRTVSNYGRERGDCEGDGGLF